MADGWSPQIWPLDTERIVTTLHEHGVRYVLVGGIAAIVHGFSGATFDFDAVTAQDTANLNRVGRALQSLGAVVYADPSRADLAPDGKPPEADDFGYTPEGLRRAKVWHLTSAAGMVDIAMAIDGVGDYRALVKAASRVDVFGIEALVASLDDIITSKRFLARAKDLRALPELEQLRDERARRKNKAP